MRTRSVSCTWHHSAPRSSASLRRRRFTLPLVLAVALLGCSSSYRWTKSGLSSSLADAKLAACRQDAELQRSSPNESEEDRSARIRRDSHLCMKADGWQLTQFDGTDSSAPASESAAKPGGEVRVAQSSEGATDKVGDKAGDKGSEKPSGKVEEKKEIKEVKEVKVSGKAADDDDEEE